MKEKVDNHTIKLYVDKLVASYGLYPLVKETALKIQFDHNLYAECTLEIMRKMGLKNTVKVTSYVDHKYPYTTHSVACITIPNQMPSFGSEQFNKIQFEVEIRESIKNNFNAFISSIAHELAHIVLYGTKHELHKSEIATDLCMLIFGFSDFVHKGKRITRWTASGMERMTLGYLSENQLHYATGYINKLRLERRNLYRAEKSV